jgi:hypothetical protein
MVVLVEELQLAVLRGLEQVVKALQAGLLLPQMVLEAVAVLALLD